MNVYSAQVRALFAAPAHAGKLDNAQSVRIDAPDVQVELAATADGDRVGTMRFLVWGCPHVIATAEAACAVLEGQPLADLLEFSAQGLMQELSVPVEKTGRILVLEDAVRSLGQAIRDGR